MDGAGLLIGSVIKIMSSIKKMLEKNEKDRAERFKGYEKIFDVFLEIDRDYQFMFNNLLDSVRDVAVGKSDRTELEAIKNSFSRRREEYEGYRTSLRASTEDFIKQVEDQKEKEFLYALFCYFIEESEPYKDSHSLGVYVNLLIKQGYGTVFNTPSSLLLKRIINENDPAKLSTSINKARQRLNEFNTTVRNSFIDLKRDVNK